MTNHSDESNWKRSESDAHEASCDWSGIVYLWFGHFANAAEAHSYFTEDLPSSASKGNLPSGFRHDFELKNSPHQLCQAGLLQWDPIGDDMFAQIKALTYGDVFYDAAGQIIDESGLGIGANVLVALYEKVEGSFQAFQPMQPIHATPLTFVGAFYIEGELVEVRDALPQARNEK